MLEFNNITYNFDTSWHKTLNSMPTDIINTLNNFDTLVGNTIPDKLLAFRIYNMSINNIIGVIVNWKPSFNSNGLLVGTYSNQMSPELASIYKNLNYLYTEPLINNDLSLEYLAEQNIFLININHTLNQELTSFYQLFTKIILMAIYNNNNMIPFLLLGDKPKIFCTNSPLNVFVETSNLGTEEFETSNGFNRFISFIDYYFNVKIKL